MSKYAPNNKGNQKICSAGYKTDVKLSLYAYLYLKVGIHKILNVFCLKLPL